MSFYLLLNIRNTESQLHISPGCRWVGIFLKKVKVPEKKIILINNVARHVNSEVEDPTEAHKVNSTN